VFRPLEGTFFISFSLMRSRLSRANDATNLFAFIVRIGFRPCVNDEYGHLSDYARSVPSLVAR
jgi:hypothetical protein